MANLWVVTGLRYEAWALRRMARSQGLSLTVFAAGPGPVRAAHRLSRALSRARPEAVLGAGLAGALAPRWAAASVVCARWVTQPQGTERRPLALAPGLPAAGLVSVPRVVARAQAKRALAAQTGAELVDQEAWSWAEVLAARGLSLTVVRAVLDGAAEDLPALAAPTTWPQVLTLPRRAEAALAALGRAVADWAHARAAAHDSAEEVGGWEGR
jgi:nucleoside phosphorylase